MMRIWYPVCWECGEVTAFAASDDIDSSQIRCQICHKVCEDGHALQKAGKLEIVIPQSAMDEYMKETDKQIVERFIRSIG